MNQFRNTGLELIPVIMGVVFINNTRLQLFEFFFPEAFIKNIFIPDTNKIIMWKGRGGGSDIWIVLVVSWAVIHDVHH